MNGSASRTTCCQVIQSFASMGIMSKASVEVASIGLVVEQGKESLKGLFDRANNCLLYTSMVDYAEREPF